MAIKKPEEITRAIEHAVEWPSLIFFICLFILSYSLVYTGVMAKLTYIICKAASGIMLLPLILLSSTALSAVLDNLSVIVAFTPVAKLLKTLGLTNSSIFFALLYGGVFGGNYTPIGSTANIVALGLSEKRRIKITWSEWLKIALTTTTMQILVALAWIEVITL